MYLKASTIGVDDALPQSLVEEQHSYTMRDIRPRRTALLKSPVAAWGTRSSFVSPGRSDRAAQQAMASRQAGHSARRNQAKLLDGFTLLKLAGVALPEDARSATCIGERFAGVEGSDLPFFTALERLVLNECTGLRLEMFASLPSLEFLSLSAGGLTECGILDAESFPRLRSLHLSHNALTQSSIRSIAALPELEVLDLSANGLSCLPTELRNCQKLVELNLSRNHFTDEHDVWSTLAFVPNLQRLNLSHNHLSQVPLGLEAAPTGTGQSEGSAAPSVHDQEEDAFPRLQWLNLASNAVQQDETVAALLSYAQNLRQLILFDNPIARPLLPSELKRQQQQQPDTTSRESQVLAAAVTGAGSEQGPRRVVNIVTDGNAATAGMAAADDATRSASIGVGMLKGTRRAAAQRAAVHSAALAAAEVVEGAVGQQQQGSLLTGHAAVPQGMAALDAALGANVGAAYTALRHRRGGALFTVTDDARRLRTAREALGGLTLQASRREKVAKAMLDAKKHKQSGGKFAGETRASLARSTQGGPARRRPDGSRAPVESRAVRRALRAAGELSQLGRPPQSLVRARQELSRSPQQSKLHSAPNMLPDVQSAKVTTEDLAAVAATLVTQEQPAVPLRLSAALSALRHAVQQPSGDDARMAQLMAKAEASRRAAHRSLDE